MLYSEVGFAKLSDFVLKLTCNFFLAMTIYFIQWHSKCYLDNIQQCQKPCWEFRTAQLSMLFKAQVPVQIFSWRYSYFVGVVCAHICVFIIKKYLSIAARPLEEVCVQTLLHQRNSWPNVLAYFWAHDYISFYAKHPCSLKIKFQACRPKL